MSNILQFVRRPVPLADGLYRGMGIAVATVVIRGRARLLKLSVISGQIAIYDAASLEAIGPECLFYVGEASGRPVDLAWPCANGITVVPTSGGIAAVIFSEL